MQFLTTQQFAVLVA